MFRRIIPLLLLTVHFPSHTWRGSMEESVARATSILTSSAHESTNLLSAFPTELSLSIPKTGHLVFQHGLFLKDRFV